MTVRDVVQAAAGVGGGGEYIEDVFSTYLYTGNGSTQTIENGIDLDGEGGLVWIKYRDGTDNHYLFDTERGVNKYLSSSTTGAEATATTLTNFNATGFSLASFGVNISSRDMASWTFRKAPKFFDVVTYTGNGVAGRTVAHNLGSDVGFFVVKRTDATGNWVAWHRSLASTTNGFLYLNDVAAQNTSTLWNSTAPTSTEFTLGDAGDVNGNGATYVAYLFASDAGGFGDDGEQNVISCGSYVGNGSTTGPEINLGWEPQWLLVKRATGAADGWIMVDTMRGLVVKGLDAELQANGSVSEWSGGSVFDITPTGFQCSSTRAATNASGETFIYIAIRRGPMKTPESGTEVLGLVARAGTGVATTVESGVLNDLAIIKNRGVGTEPALWANRLTGPYYMKSSQTSAETSSTTAVIPANPWDLMGGMRVGSTSAATNASGSNFINYQLRRAPGFMDVVAYTGTGVAGRTVAHNLGVAPEMMIVKNRTTAGYGWGVYTAPVGNTAMLQLNATSTPNTNIVWWNNTSPTSSLFTVGSNQFVNESADNYVAYLFATLPGVSKVGSYTGTGADLNIDCGFSAGARFVLIKRTDSTGDWYVWDSARGIVAGNDPYFFLNSGAAEVTSTDYIDPLASGFTVTSSAPAALNASGGTYIFLAIA